jgi:hypothetical protein
MGATVSEEVESRETRKRAHHVLVKACVFGDGFLAPGFKREAHNLFVNLKGRKPASYEHIAYAFDNLGEDDLLLNYLVDLQCIAWTPPMDDDVDEMTWRDVVPTKVLIRVMLRYYELKLSPMGESDMNLCSYHHHESDEEREACHKNKTHKAKA